MYVLVTYATGRGPTPAIAERIANCLHANGLHARAEPITNVKSVTVYQAVEAHLDRVGQGETFAAAVDLTEGGHLESDAVAADVAARPGQVRDRIAREQLDWIALLERLVQESRDFGLSSPPRQIRPS